MNKKLSTILTILTVGAVMTQPVHGTLIAVWNFNDLSNPGGTSEPSNANQTSYAPSSGSGSLTLAGWTSRAGSTSPQGISNFGGTTANAAGGDPAGQALALQGGTTGTVVNNGATLTMLFNLVGYQDPILTFATQRTSTGFTGNQLSYSTDGTTFTSFGSTYAPPSSFGIATFDLSSENSLDNQSDVYLRITFNGATSLSGNNRLDNIQLNVTAVPEPTDYALLVFGALFGAVQLVRLYRRHLAAC